MSEIDVTDVLLDPVIAAEEFIIVRRSQTVNQFGERTNTIERIYARGSITPSGDNSLTREEAFQMGQKSIKVITQVLLRMASINGPVTYNPDYVIWRGDTYVVRSVEDYSRYGAGFTESECVSIDYVDQAATPPRGKSVNA